MHYPRQTHIMKNVVKKTDLSTLAPDDRSTSKKSFNGKEKRGMDRKWTVPTNLILGGNSVDR